MIRNYSRPRLSEDRDWLKEAHQLSVFRQCPCRKPHCCARIPECGIHYCIVVLIFSMNSLMKTDPVIETLERIPMGKSKVNYLAIHGSKYKCISQKNVLRRAWPENIWGLSTTKNANAVANCRLLRRKSHAPVLCQDKSPSQRGLGDKVPIRKNLKF